MVNPEPAFWDSSALVPLCLRDPATRHAVQSYRRHPAVVWWAAAVEIYSAIARSLRSGSIDAQDARKAVASLTQIKSIWRAILPDDSLIKEACHLLDVYPLRASDSLQLAAALTWCRQHPDGKRFICADKRLSGAARVAGFSVVEL